MEKSLGQGDQLGESGTGLKPEDKFGFSTTDSNGRVVENPRKTSIAEIYQVLNQAQS